MAPVSPFPYQDKIKEQYKDRYEEFYNRFCCVDDGHAAQRVVEKVFK